MNDPSLHPVVVTFIENNDLETVEGAFAFTGGEALVKPGLGRRSRTRMRVHDSENRCWEMYLKRYESPSLPGRLVRMLTGRRKDCEAKREFEAARRLRDSGVPAMRPIVWGAEMGLLDVKRSYVIVSAVPGDALERVGEDFLQRHLKHPEILEAFTDELVRLASRMHEIGYVHRDFYASHIFLHDCEGNLRLYLIDLARAFRPQRRVFRWRVKDLAQLKYSMPWMWVKMQWKRFLEEYLGVFGEEDFARWDAAVEAKVRRMARHDQHRVKNETLTTQN
jgi:tRNA A-37 threonylcarbamoyl transferase component Bud32